MVLVSLFFVTFLLKVEFAITISDQRFISATYRGFYDDQPSNLNFQNNLKNLLGTFASQASKVGFYKSTVGEVPYQVNGLYLCRGDIDGQACSDCVTYAKDAILTPKNHTKLWHRANWFHNTEAMFWYEHCMIRYSNKSFIEMDKSFGSGGSSSHRNGSWNWIRFAKVLRSTMNQLVVQAANDESGKRFATKVANLTIFESLYAIAQCTWDLTPSECNKCLTKAREELFMYDCRGALGGRALYPSRVGKFMTKARKPLFMDGCASSANAMYPSCMVRYETFPFFNNTINLPSPSLASLAVTNLTTSSLSGLDRSEDIKAV